MSHESPSANSKTSSGSQTGAPCCGSARLSPEDISSQLSRLDHWELDTSQERLIKRLRMKDFVTAIALFQRIADVAEQMDHHPDLHLEGYRNVRIELWTHSAGGLTELDFRLAAEIDKLVQEPTAR